MTAPRKVGVTLAELLSRDAGEFLDLLADHLGATTPQGPDPDGRIAYSPDELARLAGCARSTIYEAIARGELPSRKLGGRRLIPADEMHAWLRQRQDIEAAG